MKSNVHYKVNLDEIKRLASKKGLSIAQIEKELGFGKSTIYRWNDLRPNRMHREPSVSNLYKVATLLGTSIESLLQEEK